MVHSAHGNVRDSPAKRSAALGKGHLFSSNIGGEDSNSGQKQQISMQIPPSPQQIVSRSFLNIKNCRKIKNTAIAKKISHLRFLLNFFFLFAPVWANFHRIPKPEHRYIYIYIYISFGVEFF